jgi:AraC-like DNA-binding protein
VREDIVFDPMVDLSAAPGQRIRCLVRLLIEELDHAHSSAGNDLACRSFIDLLLYSMLQALPNDYSERLARLAWSAVPGTERRAEEYIHAHAAQPIGLHDIAAAAGCSVRSLQLGFKQFLDTTPAAARPRARSRTSPTSTASPILADSPASTRRRWASPGCAATDVVRGTARVRAPS